MSTHLFAVHIPLLPSGDIFTLADESAVHRISTVLRLTSGQKIILFDERQVVTGSLLRVTKKNIEVAVEDRNLINQLMPNITWLLPLLEKEYFEEALYYLTVLGITTIVPVITQLSKKSMTVKSDRIQRILIAAAEQSKQFALPRIKEPIELEKASALYTAPFKIVFDVDGDAASQIIPTVTQEVIGMTGPEAGLTEQEKKMLMQNGYQCCMLTSTILKASHATFLAAGMIRSFQNN